MFEFLWQGIEKAKSAPVERKEVKMLPAEKIRSDRFPARVDGQRFQSGADYFAVRLAGLHVVNARSFSEQRLPLFVSLAEFSLRGKAKSVPFSVGPGEINEKLKAAGAFDNKDPKPAWIELNDLMIVPPTPVGTGNLALFAGLYSVPGSDVVRTLLDVVGKLSKTANAVAPLATIGTALDISQAVYSGFGALVGLGSVESLVQAQNGQLLAQSGYWVLANAAPGKLLEKNVTVTKGELCRDGNLITDMDYCLIGIERYTTVLEEAGNLAPNLFDDEWQTVLKSLENGECDASRSAMRKLQSAMRISPALTESDRNLTMVTYLQKYSAEVTHSERFAGPDRRTRGPGQLMRDRLGTTRETFEDASTDAMLERVLELVDHAEVENDAARKQEIFDLALSTRTALAGAAAESGGRIDDEALADALLIAV